MPKCKIITNKHFYKRDEMYGDFYQCPTCGGTDIFKSYKFCPNCGQQVVFRIKPEVVFRIKPEDKVYFTDKELLR